jgi:DNA-binding transcriptional LysR family regulator
MDVRQLKHFVALVETGTAHAAADDQHISQPGLSGSIKRLENQLGVPLFDRRGRGMVLNARGRDFYPHAKRTIEYLRLAQAELKVSDARIRIALGDTRASDFVGKLASAFREEYPSVRLEFSESHFDSIFSDLEEGTVDIALGSVPSNGKIPASLISKLMTRSAFSVFCAADHPLVEIDRCITTKDLHAYPWMFNINAPRITPHYPRMAEGPALEKNKLKIVAIDSLHMGKELVLNSDCLCHTPQVAMAVELAKGKVKQLDVPIKRLTTDVMGLRHRDIRSRLLDRAFALAEQCFN